MEMRVTNNTFLINITDKESYAKCSNFAHKNKGHQGNITLDIII